MFSFLADDTEKKINVKPTLELLKKFGVKIPSELTPERVAQIEKDLFRMRQLQGFLNQFKNLFDESTAVWEEIDGRPVLVELNGVIGAHNDDVRSGSGSIKLPDSDPRWKLITDSKSFQDQWQTLALELAKGATPGKKPKSAADDLLKTWGMKVFTADGGGRGTNGSKGNRYLNRAELFFGLRNRIRNELEKHGVAAAVNSKKVTDLFSDIARYQKIGKDPSTLIFELKNVIPQASSAIRQYSEMRSGVRQAAAAAVQKAQAIQKEQKKIESSAPKQKNWMDLFGSKPKNDGGKTSSAPLDQFQIDQKNRQLSSAVLSIEGDLIDMESRVQTYKSFGGAPPSFEPIAWKIKDAAKIADELGKSVNRTDASALNRIRNKVSNLANTVATYTPIGSGGGPGVSTGGNQPQNPYNYYPSSGGEMGPFPQTQPPVTPNYTIAGLKGLSAMNFDLNTILKFGGVALLAFGVMKKNKVMMGAGAAAAGLGWYRGRQTYSAPPVQQNTGPVANPVQRALLNLNAQKRPGAKINPILMYTMLKNAQN